MCMKNNPLKKLQESLNTSAIELYSNKRVIVFDCRCVVDYSSDYILLGLDDMKLKICGNNLVANSFSFGQTDIDGEILSLEFIR